MSCKLVFFHLFDSNGESGSLELIKERESPLYLLRRGSVYCERVEEESERLLVSLLSDSFLSPPNARSTFLALLRFSPDLVPKFRYLRRELSVW